MAGVWVEEAPMVEGRYGFGLCVLRGDLWAVGGRDKGHNELQSCERLEPTLLRGGLKGNKMARKSKVYRDRKND